MIKQKLIDFLSSNYFKYLKVLLGIIIFVLFIMSIDIKKVTSLLAEISPFALFVLLFFTVFRNFIGAIRFKILIKNISGLSIIKIMNQYFIASLYNNFLPTAIGGDAIRMMMLSKEGLAKEQSVLYVFAERIIGFYALLFIAFCSSLFWEVPDSIFRIVTGSFLVYSCVLLVFLVVHFSFKNSTLQKINNVFTQIKKDKTNILFVFLMSLVYQIVSIYISYYIAVSIGLTGYLFEFMTLVPMVWFLTMIPLSFGGLGIREFSFAYLLGLIGINSEQSTIISIGTYFTLLLSGVIGGLMILGNLYNKNEIL